MLCGSSLDAMPRGLRGGDGARKCVGVSGKALRRSLRLHRLLLAHCVRSLPATVHPDTVAGQPRFARVVRSRVTCRVGRLRHRVALTSFALGCLQPPLRWAALAERACWFSVPVRGGTGGAGSSGSRRVRGCPSWPRLVDAGPPSPLLGVVDLLAAAASGRLSAAAPGRAAPASAARCRVFAAVIMYC